MQAYVNVRWQSTVNIERKKMGREREREAELSHAEKREGSVLEETLMSKEGEEEDDHEGGAVYKFNEKERNIPENSRQSKRKKTDVLVYYWDFCLAPLTFCQRLVLIARDMDFTTVYREYMWREPSQIV